MEKASQSGKTAIAKSLSAAPKTRRPQAERSAETRKKLIAATIECLHRVGYSLTTVGMVADAAGVSRGGLTHQFASKVDLMLAVVQAVYEADNEIYSQLLGPLPSREAIASMPKVMWQVLKQPSAIAVIEIMLASRSDPVLTEKLRLMQAEIDVHAGRRVITRFKSAGLTDRKDGAAIHRMFVSAVRGLAIEAVAMGPRANVEDSIDVLTEVMTLLYPGLKSK